MLACAVPGVVTAAVDTTIATDKALHTAREYLALPADRRAALEAELDAYRGPLDPVLQALRPAPGMAESRKGEIRNEPFMAPGLRARYPDDLLFFYVPHRYDSSTPSGLLVFLHGGDGNTPREKAGSIVSRPKDDPRSYGLRRHIEQAPFITVAPSAPLRNTGQRWNVPEADAYIAAVIEECAYRFNIDANRVFLGGHSMGGYGAYHLSQRLSDRFAGCLLSAGAWRIADFRSLAGTGVFLIHGANDTAPGASPVPGQGTRQQAWTGVSFARAAVELMKRDGVEHVYREHDGGHAFSDGGDGMEAFVRWAATRTRNPLPARVVALSPRGSWLFDPVTPTPHSYWIDIDEIGEGTIDYDMIQLVGPNIAKTTAELLCQGYTLAKTRLRGGRVEAVNRGNNLIEVRTENVPSFSLWLHPRMVDFSRPVIVSVNGSEEEHLARPSLLAALRSFERNHDWGLVYQARIAIGPNPAKK